jgi:DNA mismatch repair protein MLH1
VVGKQGTENMTLVKFWDVLHMGVNVFMTKPNTVQSKKNTFLLFANNRLVESERIKRIVDNAYSLYQPKGGYSYFVYMALSVRPDLIDVNVHPTKKQVIIERQDDLCELLAEILDFQFTQTAGSRSF